MSTVYYLILLSLVVCVHGDYIVMVGVDGYSNPTGRAMDGNCCDDSDQATCSGNRRCDNRFTFCLRPLGTNSGGTTSCVGPVLTSTETNTDDGAIDFTQSTWLGLDNPLMLTGINTAWEGAQLYIEVNDRDGGSQELVDFWRLEGNSTTLPVGSTLSSSAYTGFHGRGTLTMSFQVVCAEFYSGTVCENLNECQSQSINCNQGVCVDGDGAGTCECVAGYTGQFCDTEINECETMNIDCSGRGECMDEVNSFSCDCVPGYTGQFCDTEINECETMSIDCSGNGQCMDEISSYTCACEPGYTGGDCEEDIDECSLIEPPCSGRGNCSHGINSFSCSCEPGFTGEVCETDINECIGVTCNGRGNCTDRVNGFVCDCLAGYTGDECETDTNECAGMNCSGRGQCVDLVGRFECDCEAGYAGTLCDSIDDCTDVSCSENGECVDGENSFTCLCQPGFTGDLCSVEIQVTENQGVSATVIGAVGGGVGGVIVLMIVIVTVILVFIILRRKAKAIETNPNIVYGVSNRGEESSASMYDYVAPNTISRSRGESERIEMKENEVYGLKPGARDEDIEMESNPVYNVIKT